LFYPQIGFYLSECFAQFDKHFGFAVFVELVVAPCFVVGNGQARGDAFEVESAVPHGERNIRFFIAAVFLTAQKAGRLITALRRTQPQHGGQPFAPFLPPCGTEAVTVEAVRFVFFIAFLIDVKTADPVLAGVSVIDDGIAQQAVVAVGTGAAGVFQTILRLYI